MTNRVAGKIKLQSVDQLLGVPEISGTQEIGYFENPCVSESSI